MKRLSLIVAVAVLLGLFVIVPRALDGPRPLPPPPGAPPPPRQGPIHDPVEELVYELEDMFEIQRTALVNFDPDQAAAIYADDFAGDLFFDDAPWTADLTLPHARTATRAHVPGSKPDPRALARAFLARFDSIDAITYKFDRAEGTGDIATGLTKVTFVGRQGGLPTEIFERYDAVFRRVDGAWRVVSLKRNRATRKEGTQRVFVDVTKQIGLDVEPGLDCHGCSYEIPLVHCGGLAAGDYDGDGDLDLYVTRVGSPLLMRNDGGRFVDVTAGSGLERQATGSGAIWVDFDNDGRLDLLATAACMPGCACANGCAVALYRNEGGGRFRDVTERALGFRRGPAFSACAADIDRDGDLDLFVAMYGEGMKAMSASQRIETFSYQRARDGKPDLLFVNRGDGTFEERGAAAGVADPGWGFACLFFDHGDDGWPDLYLANDFGDHAFFKNRRDGTFENATATYGLQDVGFGMGVSPVDFDRDGDLDLYVSNMYSTAGTRVLARANELPADLRTRLRKMAQGNSLLRNNGDGTFTDTAVAAGVNNAGWAWGNPVIDYNEDGWPDLYVANGFVSGRARKDL